MKHALRKASCVRRRLERVVFVQRQEYRREFDLVAHATLAYAISQCGIFATLRLSFRVTETVRK